MKSRSHSRSDLVVIRDHEFEPSNKYCIFLILRKEVEHLCNTTIKPLEEHFHWQMPCSRVYLLKKVAFPCKFLAGKHQIRCQTQSATLYCGFSCDGRSQIHGNNVGSASYQAQNLPKKKTSSNRLPTADTYGSRMDGSQVCALHSCSDKE